METVFFLSAYLLLFYSCSAYRSLHRAIRGVHPLDENYYRSEVIKCKDGSKSFSRDRLNDNFCDCVDGTDEPGTSACPKAKFYCRNAGSKPQFIFSSRVNDRFCDCCDGSDEYDGSVQCPNTCVMGGMFEYKTDNYYSRHGDLGSDDVEETKNGVNSKESVLNLSALKIFVILQVVLVILIPCFLPITELLVSCLLGHKLLLYYISLSRMMIGAEKHCSFSFMSILF
ncbi:hypothetical protein L6164_018619 [Bauhinia variegata]|uniref:Uncharacterized protein n=1 Tax=Bauhinia variegata TaxID=167791 RepID=A0ACB9NCI0_BAUVA|nr:hypothetical protein L6164_018619 [Bauhinia variegata]